MSSDPKPDIFSGSMRWIPAALFALVTIVLFRGFIFSGDMLVGQDTEALGYVARAFYAQELSDGNFPGWNPYIFGGTPFLASLAGGDSLYPPSVILLQILEPFRSLGWKLVLHVFLAGLGMYGWVRYLGVGRGAATVAGLGYLVAPYMVTLVYPAHDGKIFVTALTPYLFWAVEAWFRQGRWSAWAGIGAVIALVTLTTHFQMAYFLFGAVGAYAIFRFVQQSRRATPGRAAPRFALFLTASLVGAGAAGVQLLPAIEYIGSESRRTATTTQASPEENKAYAGSWSLHFEEVVSLVIPEFIGSDAAGSEWSTGTYWGRNQIKFNHEYIGLVLLILAALGFAARPPPGLRWFLVGLAGFSFLYALGPNTPVWHLFYAIVPGIDLFRAASMVIFLTGFAVITLAAFGADRLVRSAERSIPGWMEEAGTAGVGSSLTRVEVRVLAAATAIVGALFLGAASGALTNAWTDTLYTGITAQNQAALDTLLPYIGRGALVALLLSVAVLATGWAAREQKLSGFTVAATLAILVVVDGARVDAPFIQTTDFEAFASPQPLEEQLGQRVDTEPPFRLLDMRQAGGSVRGAMFGIELAGGHHPNDLARYREVIGAAGSGAPLNLLESSNLLRMLNIRYVLWPTIQYGDAAGQIPSLAGATAISATQLQDGRTYETVYQVPDLPRARLVAEAEVVAPRDAVGRLMDPTFPAESSVLLEEPAPIELGGGVPEGDVVWIEREVDHHRLTVTTDRASLLLIADNWYPAWNATVSGTDAPVLRANHTLRAIPVPAGTHEVEVTFRDSDVRAGLIGSIVAGVILLGALLFGLFVQKGGAGGPIPEPDAPSPATDA